jgi:phosphoglycerate dehydrogenase-like enzyme
MGERRTVVIGVDLEGRYLDRLRREFPAVHFPVCTTPEALRAAVGAADALIGGWQLAPDLLDAAPSLRWIQATGAGVERYLTPQLLARPIALTNFSGIHAPNIAEHVLALILAFARGLRPLLRQQDRHQWRDDDGRPPVFELEGQTLGVVGLGDIGEALARKGRGIGMRVLATRRNPERGSPHVDRLLGSDGLPELLAEADHVALCLPLTAETARLIGREELARMKPTAYLYNIGRGGSVDQDALLAALTDGTIAGAGLDVTAPEPLPPDSPLWDLPNVIITMHTSGATPRYWDRGIELVVDNLRRFLAGEPLRNVVDTAAGY